MRFFIVLMTLAALTGGLSAFAAGEKPGKLTNAETTESLSSEAFHCELAQRYLAQADFQIDCEKSYHHYWMPNAEGSKDSRELKIASWNLFNLGLETVRFKDLKLVAQVFETQKWDVVSAVELFPLESDRTRENVRLDQFIKNQVPQGSQQADEARGHFSWPGAVELLLELRKLDPTWSLIVAPKGQGSDGASALELGGVYYRASRVKAIETESCKSLACLVVLPKKVAPNFPSELLGELVSREPFLASFKSRMGGFDFTILPYHARFRHSKRNEVTQLIAGLRWSKAGKPVFQNPLLDLDRLFGKERASAFRADLVKEGPTGPAGAEKKDSAKETLGRFAELAVIGKFIETLRASTQEQDYIWAGDFNLELKDSVNQARAEDNPWEFILTGEAGAWPGASVLVKERTSVSDKEKVKSNYDHFILDEKLTSECRAASAEAVDMMSEKVTPGVEDYLVFWNLGSEYQSALLKNWKMPKPPRVLVQLATSKPSEFQALSLSERLGLTVASAKKISAMAPAQQIKVYEKLEKLFLKKLTDRHNLVVKSNPAVKKQVKRIEEFEKGLAERLMLRRTVVSEAKGLEPRFLSKSEIKTAADQRRSTEFLGILQDFRRRLFESQWWIDPKTGREIRWQVYRELLSDHLPIHMSCDLPNRDDD